MNPSISSQLAIPSKVLRASQVDDPDRRLAKAYADEHHTSESEIKRRYAATGDLTCNGVATGQANVTLVGDVITTAAHSIFLKPNCGQAKQKLKGCKLVAEIEGERQEYEIDEVINTGYICGSPDMKESGTDWAVLRLKKKVDPRINPTESPRPW